MNRIVVVRSFGYTNNRLTSRTDPDSTQHHWTYDLTQSNRVNSVHVAVREERERVSFSRAARHLTRTSWRPPHLCEMSLASRLTIIRDFLSRFLQVPLGVYCCQRGRWVNPQAKRVPCRRSITSTQWWRADECDARRSSVDPETMNLTFFLTQSWLTRRPSFIPSKGSATLSNIYIALQVDWFIVLGLRLGVPKNMVSHLSVTSHGATSEHEQWDNTIALGSAVGQQTETEAKHVCVQSFGIRV